MTPFPATTYDFFPYAGLHRPVVLYSVPAAAHIEDITVVTTIEGANGVAHAKVATAGVTRFRRPPDATRDVDGGVSDRIPAPSP